MEWFLYLLPIYEREVLDKLNMLWMGIWRHILPITITTT